MPGMKTDPNKKPEDFWLSKALRTATSLDPQPDQSLGQTGGEMAAGFLPIVGQAMALRDFERARRDSDYLGMGLSAASLIPGGQLLKALRGAKNEMIAGREALKAPHAALDHAEAMHKAGKTAQEQWDETGRLFGEKNRAFVGKEGKPMWEIDDSKARFIGAPDDLESFPYILREKLHHPELYENYPTAAEAMIRGGINPKLPKGYGEGGFGHPLNPTYMGTFKAEASDTPELLSTLLHEVQHGVQRKEGFEGGTSATGLRALLGDRYMDKFGAPAEELHGKAMDVSAERLYRSKGGERNARVVEGTWGTPEGPHPQDLIKELKKTVPINRADPWDVPASEAWYGEMPLPGYLK